jgi:beta-glucanase (GH16 family)
MPKGKRVWPAIWTLGTNIKTVGYPICGEIDINEFYGGTLMTAVCHFADPEGLDRIKPKSISAGTSRTHIQNPCEGFHVYAMEWDENEIRFLVDGVPFGTLKTEVAGHASINPYRKPHYLLLNFALTGQGNESIDDGSNTSHLFQIDYVRYFQKK